MGGKSGQLAAGFVADGDAENFGPAVAEAMVDVGDFVDDFGRGLVVAGMGMSRRRGPDTARPSDHRGKVLADHQVGFSDGAHAPVIQPEGAIADGLDIAGGMGDEQDGDSARAELMNFAHAAVAEVDIADRESFIDQKNFRIEMDGDGEREAHDHAARIGLDRLVDEIADFGEVFDFGEARDPCPWWRAPGWRRSDKHCRGRKIRD